MFLLSIRNTPVKIIGLTATPYRLTTTSWKIGWNRYQTSTSIKLINRIKGGFWKRILFNLGIGELIDQKYLCPIEYIDRSIIQQENIPLNKSQSDFDLEAYEKIISVKQKEIINTIEYAKMISKGILIFCSSVKQAETLQKIIFNSAIITAKTHKKEREEIINKFRDGEIKVVFNVGVLTIGFDYPELDCIILLRPTRSIGLLAQMIGRGLRIAEGKKNCKVIDMTSTIKNLGRVETIKLEKIDDKWDLISETKPNGWHGVELYNFVYENN